MIIDNIHAIYFSPTGGTKKVVDALEKELSAYFNVETKYTNLTFLENRKKIYRFDSNCLVLLAIPVYAGRIPNKLLPDLEKCLQGNETPMIPICVYGNRNYDDALRELLLLSEKRGFIPVAINYDRETPIAPYYTPLKTDRSPARFLKAKPATDVSKCTNCGICIRKCPMSSISAEDATLISGICIKCQACVRSCPEHAKYFADEDFLSHVSMLESTYMTPKEPEFYM